MAKRHYTLRPTTTPLPSAAGANGTTSHERSAGHDAPAAKRDDPFARPEAEDDDGYDPYSDRPPTPEPTFQQDPWN